MPPGLERGADCARTQTRKVLEEHCELAKYLAVVASIGNQQEEALGRIVAALQVDPATHCLHIAEAHLELHCGALATTEDHGVPCPPLPTFASGEGHLDPRHERRRSHPQDGLQPAGMSDVADGNPSWVDPKSRLQPEHAGKVIELED